MKVWQLIVATGALWIIGTLIMQTGLWVSDKTAMIAAGAGLVCLGSLLQFIAFVALFVK